MAEAQPSAASPRVPEEAPSPNAELMITVGPTERWRASGRVPSDEAHHLITTFGVLTSTVAGIGGAVLTLNVANGTTGVAFAAAILTLSLIATILITVVGRSRVPRRGRGS